MKGWGIGMYCGVKNWEYSNSALHWIFSFPTHRLCRLHNGKGHQPKNVKMLHNIQIILLWYQRIDSLFLLFFSSNSIYNNIYGKHCYIQTWHSLKLLEIFHHDHVCTAHTATSNINRYNPTINPIDKFAHSMKHLRSSPSWSLQSAAAANLPCNQV